MGIIRFIVFILLLMPISLSSETIKEIHPIFTFSSNGSIIIKIDAPSKMGAAEATFYKLSKDNQLIIDKVFKLKDGKMPRDGFVSDTGSLITLDSWYSYGVSKNVVVKYDNHMKVVSSYSLNDLYTEKQLSRFFKTSSSIYWRCMDVKPNIYHGNILHVYDQIGGELVIDMDSGKIEYKKVSDIKCSSIP